MIEGEIVKNTLKKTIFSKKPKTTIQCFKIGLWNPRHLRFWPGNGLKICKRPERMRRSRSIIFPYALFLHHLIYCNQLIVQQKAPAAFKYLCKFLLEKERIIAHWQNDKFWSIFHGLKKQIVPCCCTPRDRSETPLVYTQCVAHTHYHGYTPL